MREFWRVQENSGEIERVWNSLRAYGRVWEFSRESFGELERLFRM